jgi:hypothetical protein
MPVLTNFTNLIAISQGYLGLKRDSMVVQDQGTPPGWLFGAIAIASSDYGAFAVAGYGTPPPPKPPPTLYIERIPGGRWLSVYWQNTNYILEVSTNISDPTSWTAIPHSPGYSYHQTQITNQAALYRLKQHIGPP